MANKPVRLTPAEGELIRVIRGFSLNPERIKEGLVHAQVNKSVPEKEVIKWNFGESKKPV